MIKISRSEGIEIGVSYFKEKSSHNFFISFWELGIWISIKRDCKNKR
jgi:hypothetical protein